MICFTRCLDKCVDWYDTVYTKFAGHGAACRTSPAKIKNVRRRVPVKFNQMSGEEVEMSGEAQKNFVYTGYVLQ